MLDCQEDISLAFSSYCQRVLTGIAMLKNYLKIAFRNLWRRQGFSFINITGLAVGMASAALILLWVVNELSYDDFQKNKEHIYKVWNRGFIDGAIQSWDATPMVMAASLKAEFPDIQQVVRGDDRWFVTVTGDKKVSSHALVTDTSFLSMFSFPLLKGDAATALRNSNSIVVTEKMAKKMFGEEDAMGKDIRINQDHFTVTGILKDLPVNTSFDFEYLLPWDYHRRIGEEDDIWGNNAISTWVQLAPGSTEAVADAKIRDLSQRHSKGTVKEELFLHPMSKWRLYSNFENGKNAGGRISVVRLFSIIAAFILLIACINFMNLSTARSEQRAKEVGIRKVSGAHRGLLIGQFLGESVLIALLAGILAFFLVLWSLPAFDRLINQQLTLPYDRVGFWVVTLLFVLISGLAAGIYPAFFISSFQPVSVLKGTFRRAHAVVNPRKVLVVLQFSFAIILMICTFIVVQQLRYVQGRETGYNREQLAYHWATGDLNKNFPQLRQELLANGIASHVSRSNSPLTQIFSDSWNMEWVGKNANDKIDIWRYSEDEGLVSTAGLKLVAGRDMDLASYPTDSTAVILNEAAVRTMGFKNPIGQFIKDNDVTYHVIGVIKDFIIGSPYEIIHPMVIEGTKGLYFNVINIKLTAGMPVSESIRKMGAVFSKYNPQFPYEYHFVDEDYARKFEDNEKIGTMTGLFAGLAILISCLGLFGLAAYMAESRVKEIGVRKVLGASVFRITALLSKEFMSLVLLSILIASPIAWYAMHSWLMDYSYHVSIAWWIFCLTGGGALLIALLTVSFQTIKAARANPIRNLRAE